MGERLFVSIPNWDKFQHYKDRHVPWIKTYTELINRDDYRSLSMHQRGVLHSIWLAYAAGHRQLSGDTLALTRQLGQRVVTRDLAALNHAGFIDLVSRPHKDDPARASLDLTRSLEEENLEKSLEDPAIHPAVARPAAAPADPEEPQPPDDDYGPAELRKSGWMAGWNEVNGNEPEPFTPPMPLVRDMP